MTDSINIPVKFKEQCKFYTFTNTAILYQHPFRIQLLLQDLRAEPLRD